jgi:hypothetical protein
MVNHYTISLKKAQNSINYLKHSARLSSVFCYIQTRNQNKKDYKYEDDLHSFQEKPSNLTIICCWIQSQSILFSLRTNVHLISLNKIESSIFALKQSITRNVHK